MKEKQIVNQESSFDEVMKALTELQAKTGETWEFLARQMNVNPSALSAAKSNNYKGDTESMKKKIVDFLVILGKQKEQMFDFAYADTGQSMRIISVLRECHEAREMGAIWGPAGIGKSTGLRKYREKYESQVYIVDAYEGIEPKDLMEKFLRMFGIEMSGCANPKMEAIIEFIKGKPWLLGIDDAHYLTPKNIEKMRRIYDATNVGIVFCGNETTIGQMQGGRQKLYFSHVFSRIPNRLGLNVLPTRDDIEALCKATKIEIKANVCDWLLKYALLEGHYRYLKYLMRKAINVMKNNGDKELTIDHLTFANEFHFGIKIE